MIPEGYDLINGEYVRKVDATLVFLSFVGGTMGIGRGAVGKKVGGILMIIGGILALIGAGLFGFLGLVLLVVGGAMAFREARFERPRHEII